MTDLPPYYGEAPPDWPESVAGPYVEDDWRYGGEVSADPNRCSGCGRDLRDHCRDCMGCWDHSGNCRLDPDNLAHERERGW